MSIDSCLAEHGLSCFEATSNFLKGLIDQKKATFVGVINWLDNNYSYHRKHELVQEIQHNESLFHEIVEAFKNDEISLEDLTFKYICHCVPGNTSIDMDAFIVFEFELLERFLELKLLNFNDFIDEISSKSLSTHGKDCRGMRQEFPEFCFFIANSDYSRNEFGADTGMNFLEILLDKKRIDESNLKYVLSKIEDANSFFSAFHNECLAQSMNLLETLKKLSITYKGRSHYGCVVEFPHLLSEHWIKEFDQRLTEEQQKELREFCLTLFDSQHLEAVLENGEILKYALEIQRLSISDVIDYAAKNNLSKALLENSTFYSYAFEKDINAKKNLAHLWESVGENSSGVFFGLIREPQKYLAFVENGIFTTTEFIKAFCESSANIEYFMKNQNFFSFLIDSNLLSTEDVQNIINALVQRKDRDETTEFCGNAILVQFIIHSELKSELVSMFEKFEKIGCRRGDATHAQLFFENLSIHDIQSLDSETMKEILSFMKYPGYFSQTLGATEYYLKNFMFDYNTVKKLNSDIKNSDHYSDRYKRLEFFEFLREALVSRRNNDDMHIKELLKLIELNKTIYVSNSFNLNLRQKLELAEVLKDNEIAQNRLIQIVENNLEFNYDFESLMKYLKKPEKKTLINI